jgi:glycine cleavage system H protein
VQKLLVRHLYAKEKRHLISLFLAKSIMQIPKLLKYTATHEWIQLEATYIALVGITYHAQASLGDIVFVDLPGLHKSTQQGEEVCVLESVKAAADVYSPLSGTIIEINTELLNAPELINQDPYGKAWLFRIKFSNRTELDTLLTAENYSEQISSEIH